MSPKFSKYCTPGVVAILALALSPHASSNPAASTSDAPAVRELIVRLSAHHPLAPTPEELVHAVRSRQPAVGIPGFILPSDARTLIAPGERTPDAAKAGVPPDADSARARLERFVVLRYSPEVDLAAVREVLELDPAIEWVGPNRIGSFSLVPNDPLYATNQWGHQQIRLETAWDWIGGHAYVGVLDTGIVANHLELRGQTSFGGWSGGAFRPSLSYDVVNADSTVDEYELGWWEHPDGSFHYDYPERAGHGSFVAGTIGARTNNSLGVAGSCLQCSLLVIKANHHRQALADGQYRIYNDVISEADAAAAITAAVDRGAQALNLSFGFSSTPCSSSGSPICSALDLATSRDVTVVAASGNDGNSSLDFPASDTRVLAAGGIVANQLWSGSNYAPKQFLLPAGNWSTFYPGLSYAPSVGCDESHGLPVGDGYGPCLGTSISAPFLTAGVALLRSANPHLTRSNIEDLLKDNLRFPYQWSWQQGVGIPELDQAVYDALGRAGGVVVANRLTPLFSLYSNLRTDHLYTTVPQWGAVARGAYGYYASTGPDVPAYGDFPGAPCFNGPCAAARASLYLFVSTRAPYAGAPGLTPLYRSTFKATSGSDRDSAYAIDASGISNLAQYGYQVDGVEGYLYAPCTPEPSCVPAGAAKVLQRYHPTRNDHAVFPESDLAAMQAAGYTQIRGTGTLGYAYRNIDTDGDQLIDGFEQILGTSPGAADSDCDGVNDGQEILVYSNTSGYGDPLDATCP